MKKIILFSTVILLASFIKVQAQPYLTLSGDPGMCNDVTVIAYVHDASCINIDKTIRFTVTPGMAPTAYDLNNAANWNGGVPAGVWTIEEIAVVNTCSLNKSGGAGNCINGDYNATLLETGINCGAITTSACFEYDATCGGCSSGDVVNVNLSVSGNDVTVDIL